MSAGRLEADFTETWLSVSRGACWSKIQARCLRLIPTFDLISCWNGGDRETLWCDWLYCILSCQSRDWQRPLPGQKAVAERFFECCPVLGCGAGMLLIPHTGTPMDGRLTFSAVRCGVSCRWKRRQCAKARPLRSPVNVSWWGSHESRKRPCRVSYGIRATDRKAGRVNSSTDQKPERATK